MDQVKHTIFVGICSISKYDVVSTTSAECLLSNGDSVKCPFYAFSASKEELKERINHIIDEMYKEHASISVQV